MLTDPKLAARSCDDCKRWVYDAKTGERAMRGNRPVERPSGVPTPCHACPKKSPAQANEHELTAKNYQTYQTYLESQATCGVSLTAEQRRCGVLLRRLALIHRIVREVEQTNLQRAVSLGGTQRAMGA